MEFQCPKCKYPLTGTPDVCPLCHTPLRYTVETNDGSAISSMGIGTSSLGGASVDTGLRGADMSSLTTGSTDSGANKKMAGKITAFNIVTIIYNIMSLGFFAFLLLFPMFTSTPLTTSNFSNPVWQLVGFPEMTYSYLDYLVYVVWTTMQIIASEGFNFGFISPYLLHIPILFLGVIAFFLMIPSLIINIINLCKKQLPRYIRDSSKNDKIGDPLNPLGHIISISVFFMGAIYLPYLVGLLPFDIAFLKNLDNVLYYSLTPMAFLTLACAGAMIVIAIVRAVFRGMVNPK